MTLKLCHGGSVAVCGRFGKRDAAASAARAGVRQGGAGVASVLRRAAANARGPRLATWRVFPPRFPGSGVRTSSLHCSANSEGWAAIQHGPFNWTAAASLPSHSRLTSRH